MGIFSRLAGVFQRRAPALPSKPTSITVREKDIPSRVRGAMVASDAGRIWEPSDTDGAKLQAEGGQLFWLARLIEAMRGDGTINGLLGTRSAFVDGLPLLHEGDPWLVDRLRGRPAEYDPETSAQISPRVAGMWRRLLPRAEVAAMVEDGIMAGAGIGYLEDDPRPGGWRRLRHLDLHWLSYLHSEDAFYYQDAQRGRLRVTPGDGRWVLFTPYGRHRFWARGSWFPCARAFVAKYGANLDRQRWQKSLADALRWIEQNSGASEVHLQDMVRFMREGWGGGVPGIVLPEGYKAGITESTGKGYEVYKDAEERADAEIQVALTGNRVTTEGNKGFSSGDIFRDIALTLIQTTASEAAECIGEQVLDPWTSAIGLGPDVVRVSWDVRDPSQRAAAAEVAKKAAEAVKAVNEIAAAYGQRVKLAPFLGDHGVAVELEDITGAPRALPSPPPGALSLPEGGGEAPTDDAAAALAEKMTEHGVDRCEHGSSNRCRLCGVERSRDFDMGPDGVHTWRVAWRPIQRAAVASRELTSRVEYNRNVGGVVVVVEHPAGSVRAGVGPDGTPWTTRMLADYGRIPGTMGADGEAVDAYVGPDDAAPSAWLISQLRPDGTPDEVKVMLGFSSAEDAKATYQKHVPPWAFGSMVEVPVADILDRLTGRVS